MFRPVIILLSEVYFLLSEVYFRTGRSITTHFRHAVAPILALEGIEAEATKLEK